MKNMHREILRLRAALGKVNHQTVWVLILAGLLVFLHRGLGSRRFFARNLSELFPEYWEGVAAWGWWFGIKGIAGFVIPVFVLMVIFKRRPNEIGLGLGDVRFARLALTIYLPAALVGTWVLSGHEAFVSNYPHFRSATTDWTLLLTYEILYLVYWVGWEYLWRGFVLFGTAPTFGIYSIFVQALPFAVLHASKPIPEQILAVVGGVVIGAVVWRCRSFWIAVPIHAAQMAFLDIWCTLRLRTGTTGVSGSDLLNVFRF